MSKRISFKYYDAVHIYEWLKMYWHPRTDCGGCFTCENLGKRLENFIGLKMAAKVRKTVRKYPKRGR